MKVKVCGITSYEDAALALDHGVDALGFNFFVRSPRYINPPIARSIIHRLPPFVTMVGLFVNIADSRIVEEVAKEAGVQVLQLHGDESPEYCRRLQAWPLIKVLRVDGELAMENLPEYPVQAFLLDSRDDVKFGGTGKRFDWSLAMLVRDLYPIILSGGLNSENVREAVETVRPYGLDVCSSVESAPGKKDAAKLVAFMSEVRNACKSI